MFKVATWLMLVLSFTINAKQSISFAVGHDHEKMVNNYAFYAASWKIINDELAKLGYEIAVYSYPWARAKEKVKRGEHDGLFMAANLPGREKWATLTHTLGYDEFGLFKNKQGQINAPIGSVRLKSQYSMLTFLPNDVQLKFSTAQDGLKLLANNKLSAFAMSRSYGEYLLNTDLKSVSATLYFSEEQFELYSAHVAVSKEHAASSAIISILNTAIENAISSGNYLSKMTEYNVRNVQLVEQ